LKTYNVRKQLKKSQNIFKIVTHERSLGGKSIAWKSAQELIIKPIELSTWKFYWMLIFLFSIHHTILQTYAQQITLSYVSLKIRVNRPIMKLSGKNITCVSMWVFYYNSVFKWWLSAFLIFATLYTQNLQKNWTIVKKPHTNTDSGYFKIHNRLIH